MEIYYDHKNGYISINLQRQKLVSGASKSFRCNVSHQRPGSEPRDLPASPEEPFGCAQGTRQAAL